MDKIKKFNIYIWAILLIIIDQLIKTSVLNNIQYNSITVIKNILKFSYCENRGVAFSFGEGHIFIFVVLNILLICGLIFFYEKNCKDFNWLNRTCITMVIAGGVSNLIDRVVRGYVIDFIDINELFHFAIFNVADIFIVLGIIGLAITMIMKGMKS